MSALLERLLRVPSPTGNEQAAVRLMQEQAEADGFRVLRDAAGNFIAETGSGPVVWFLGHIDTVPGDIPVRVEAGRLWGRGAVDAKGPLVAAYEAARTMHDAPITLRVIGAVGEEGDSRGARALLQGPPPAAIIIGEPSGLAAITIGYKGIVRGQAHLRLPTRHGGHPGPHAIDALVAWIGAVKRRLDVGEGFDEVGMRLDAIRGEDDGLVTEASVRFQVRLPPACTCAKVIDVLHEEARGHQIRLHIEEQIPAALCDPRSRLVAHLRNAIRETGARPVLKKKTGTADLNLMAAAWPDVPMCAYGPGDSGLDHAPDERVSLAEHAAAIRVLAGLFAALAEDAENL